MTMQKKDFIIKSNQSVRELLTKGFKPQGYDFKLNKVAVLGDNGKIHYFDNYIDAINLITSL
jgi:hypothetical protein